MKIILCALCLNFVMSSSVSYAYWVWTPESKKWVNPKWASKDAPKDQYDYAKGFYDQGNYKKAIKEFNKLLRDFSKSKHASEAQFFLAKSFDKLKKYYRAYSEYQKTVEKYPGTDKINEILEQEMRIADYFFNKKPVSISIVKLPKNYEYCIEIYTSIVKNAPYSKFADKAQFFLAESYKKSGDLEKSIQSYRKLIDKYTKSKFVEESKYNIAVCSSKTPLENGYSEKQIKEVIKDFKQKTKQDSKAIKSNKISKEVTEMINSNAKRIYEIALFYERDKNWKASVLYYEDVYVKYPDTKYAKLAMGKIKNIKENKLKE